jgi:hypothetical protein
MALVHGKYYQKSIRLNGRVTTRSYGRGGRILSEMDRGIAEEKQQERAERKLWEQEQVRLYREFKKQTAAVNRLLVIALNALGFVRQCRTPWRRSRVEKLPRRYPNRGDAEIRQRMRELVNDYCRGILTANDELHDLAKRYPQEYSAECEMNMREMAIQTLVNHELPKHDAHSNKLRVDWRAQIAIMTRELAGENPSPARRLCAVLVALADTEFFLLTVNAATHGMQTEAPSSARRRTFAHRRYLSALKTLAQIEQAEKRSRRMVQVVTMAEA